MQTGGIAFSLFLECKVFYMGTDKHGHIVSSAVPLRFAWHVIADNPAIDLQVFKSDVLHLVPGIITRNH